jgi:hypothetical protein
LVPDRGGAEFQTAGNLLVVEDLKRGTNKDMGPKDIFEMGFSENSMPAPHLFFSLTLRLD